MRNNFHVTLHRLRRTLGGSEWIVHERDRYRVNEERLQQFDVRDFEQGVARGLAEMKQAAPDAALTLESALAHYRGDLLEGESAGDWHLESRDHLQRYFVDGMMALGVHHARAGQYAKAADAFRRLLTYDNLHEDALRALMTAQASLGERPQALREYQRYAERLRRELGAVPAAETQRLALHLRS